MLGLWQQPQQLFDPRMMLSDPMWDTRADTGMALPNLQETDTGFQVYLAHRVAARRVLAGPNVARRRTRRLRPASLAQTDRTPRHAPSHRTG